MLQRLGFADAGVRIVPRDVLEKPVDSVQHLAVVPLPVEIILPGIG
jgi:hypothetical protein